MGHGRVLEGVVERLIFVGGDGFTVAALDAEHGGGVKIRGKVLRGLQPGETVRVHGHEVASERGQTLHVVECERVLPAGVRAIRAYLGSGLVRGIGPALAAAIVGHFGEDTLDVVDSAPERLLEVYGIGRERLAKIMAAWARQREIREVMVFLQGVGVSPGLAVRIHRVLGEGTLRTVRENPYSLVQDVHGIGFDTADRIALAVGVPEESPERMKAALLHHLDQMRAKGGHCYLHHGTLIREAVKLTGQPGEGLRAALSALRRKNRVVVEPPTDGGDEDMEAVYPRWAHETEVALAVELHRVAAAPTRMPGVARFRDLPDTWESGAATLSREQADAVRTALTSPLAVITGGPGCGKSFTVSEITRQARAAGARVTLAAPTGKAARRLSALAGRPAMTVHRLVRGTREPVDDGGLFDADDPLEADLIVVDEASMLDIGLAHDLAAKVPAGTHLLLVGDVDQLPSIGAGSVLRDMLTADVFPVVRLTTVYRQAGESAIVANAHRVRLGREPVNGAEFWFLPVEDPEQIAATVVDVATKRLPARYGVAPDDVQVLCPGTRGPTGTLALGSTLHDLLNPLGDGVQHWDDDRPFRLGDKVMPIRNNYTKGTRGVFNGSTGVVTGLDAAERVLEVTLDDGEAVTYDFDELHELAHAYAITVHRSQGSEYPYVVIPLASHHGRFLLQRSLLYTAITRARTMVVLVGQVDALRTAVRNQPVPRNTRLADRLGDPALSAG